MCHKYLNGLEREVDDMALGIKLGEVNIPINGSIGNLTTSASATLSVESGRRYMVFCRAKGDDMQPTLYSNGTINQQKCTGYDQGSDYKIGNCFADITADSTSIRISSNNPTLTDICYIQIA